MTQWYCAPGAVLLLAVVGNVHASVIISEYVEGSSNNKAIELFNTESVAVDLDAGNFVLQFYFNGNTTPGTNIALSGTIAPHGTFVIADDGAATDILSVANQVSSSSFFNGDDAVVLRQGGPLGSILDVIGTIGEDPGTEWGTGLTSTQNNTLRRKSTVLSGDTDASDPFDPSGEWIGFAKDTFDGLGSHHVVPEPTSLVAWSVLLLLSTVARRRFRRRCSTAEERLCSEPDRYGSASLFKRGKS